MIRLAVRVPSDRSELVLAELIDLAPSGVEERLLDDGRVEYAVYGAAGELPDLGGTAAHVAGIEIEVLTEEVADDWHERWREFHKPITIGGKLHVRPPWLDAQPGLLDLVIDPGRAFGTGAHETTQLCLELLMELEPASGAMLDLGCGSGVLAIAAAQRGFGPVVGLDFDPASVEATDENAAVNGVDVRAAKFDLMHADAIPSAPVVAANLLRPLLLLVAATGFTPEPPRVLIASGLLRAEADEVVAAFAVHGLAETGRRELGDWAALLLTR